ncbi:MAG: metallophosphatase family protein [Selenomonas sp.]|uniref:metallophosphoesterase family protein n=1 Tax=Selenomonas sp. TaxID=2053611 RepID=UPI0025F5C2AE|nr:metallophosphoesterase family protein [Selenomonas sp.]MCR5437995.1 metallophosphatase family protein [Selenomonas sp.]
MKVGIVSDSHGNTNALDAMLQHPAAVNVEVWLFAGDIAMDAEYLEMVTDLPVIKVAGNNDWPMSRLEDTVIADLGGHRILLTHGHLYGVGFSTQNLVLAAVEQAADIAIYGHTHVADVSIGEVTVLNPGSVARPRDASRGSFMVAELAPEQHPVVKLIRI